MESVGFKEWAAVCEALGRGAQSIILRKGGLAEGRDGFSFQHREFFLFPTWFHEQLGKVRGVNIAIPEPKPGVIEIELFAKLELTRVINSWPMAEALEPFHILQPSVVRNRFEYERLGLHVGFARIFHVVPTWTFPNDKKYGGCRSWLILPIPPAELRLDPVLSETEHAGRRDQFLMIVDSSVRDQNASAVSRTLEKH
jgi:hypothetical protein